MKRARYDLSVPSHDVFIECLKWRGHAIVWVSFVTQLMTTHLTCRIPSASDLEAKRRRRMRESIQVIAARPAPLVIIRPYFESFRPQTCFSHSPLHTTEANHLLYEVQERRSSRCEDELSETTALADNRFLVQRAVYPERY